MGADVGTNGGGRQGESWWCIAASLLMQLLPLHSQFLNASSSSLLLLLVTSESCPLFTLLHTIFDLPYLRWKFGVSNLCLNKILHHCWMLSHDWKKYSIHQRKNIKATYWYWFIISTIIFMHREIIVNGMGTPHHVLNKFKYRIITKRTFFILTWICSWLTSFVWQL